MAVFEEEIRLFLEQLRSAELPSDVSENPFQEASITTSIIDTEPAVAILPRDLRETQRTLARTSLPDQMYSIFGSLFPFLRRLILNGTRSKQMHSSGVRSLKHTRERAFLPKASHKWTSIPRPLVNLAERHQSAPPTVTVIGEKGSGKSYTFMSLALSKTWEPSLKGWV
jgi:hypothetical protein